MTISFFCACTCGLFRTPIELVCHPALDAGFSGSPRTTMRGPKRRGCFWEVGGYLALKAEENKRCLLLIFLYFRISYCGVMYDSVNEMKLLIYN